MKTMTILHEQNETTLYDENHIIIVSPSAITHVEKVIQTCQDEICNIGKTKVFRGRQVFARKWVTIVGGLLLGVGFFAFFVLLDQWSVNPDQVTMHDNITVISKEANIDPPTAPHGESVSQVLHFPSVYHVSVPVNPSPAIPPLQIQQTQTASTPATPPQIIPNIPNHQEPEKVRQQESGTESQPENQKLFETEQLFQQAVMLLTQNPVQSMLYALQSIQKFSESSQEIPSRFRWLLNQSVAAQDLGMALNGFRGGIQTLTASDDGQWLMFCTTEGQIWIWDVHEYDKTTAGYLLDTVHEGINKLCFTSDLAWAIAVTTEGTLLFWDMSQAQPAESRINWTVPAFAYTDIVVSPDAMWMAGIGQTSQESPMMLSSQNAQNTVHLFNMDLLTQNKQVSVPTQLNSYQKSVKSMTISSDSRWLVAGSEDAISLYDLRASDPRLMEIVLKNDGVHPVSHVATSADSQWLVTVDEAGTVKIWYLENIQNRKQPNVFCENRMPVTSLALSDNQQWLALGSADNTVHVWKWNPRGAAELAYRLSGHQDNVQSLQFSRKNDSLVSRSKDNEVRIWDLTQQNPEEQVLVFKNRSSGSLSSVLLTADERWLILGQKSHDVADSQPGLRLWPMNFDEVFPCAVLYSHQYQPKNMNNLFFDQNTWGQARSVHQNQSISR